MGEPPKNETEMKALLGWNPDVPLRDDLKRYVVEQNGMTWFHHPLSIQTFFTEEMSDLVHKQIDAKTAAIKQAAEEGNWWAVVFLHERPYRWEALWDCCHLLSQRKVSELFCDVWQDSENIAQYANRVSEMMTGISGRWMMEPEEKEVFDALPKTGIIIYRGYPQERGVADGYSYSLDRDKAVWFAKRFCYDGDVPMLRTVRVDKRELLCYLDGRNEKEVIVRQPDTVEVVSDEVVGPRTKPHKPKGKPDTDDLKSLVQEMGQA